MSNITYIDKYLDKKFEKELKDALDNEVDLRKKESLINKIKEINPNNNYLKLAIADCYIQDYYDDAEKKKTNPLYLRLAYNNIIEVLKQDAGNEQAWLLSLDVLSELTETFQIGYEEYGKALELAINKYPKNIRILFHGIDYYKYNINDFKKFDELFWRIKTLW